MTKIEIEQLKASYPIENVIGETVKLERKGTNYVGLCPFHEDHHPSLVVNPQKQTFKCFACGEHGDVIEFIEKTEHCNFMEAVGKLKIENRELKINKKNANPVDRDNDAKQFSIKKNLQFFSTLLPYACGYTELMSVSLRAAKAINSPASLRIGKITRLRIAYHSFGTFTGDCPTSKSR